MKKENKLIKCPQRRPDPFLQQRLRSLSGLGAEPYLQYLATAVAEHQEYVLVPLPIRYP